MCRSSMETPWLKHVCTGHALTPARLVTPCASPLGVQHQSATATAGASELSKLIAQSEHQFCEEASQVSHHQATNGDLVNIAYDQGGCVRVKGGVRKAEGSAGRKPACAGLRTTACAVPVVSLSVS